MKTRSSLLLALALLPAGPALAQINVSGSAEIKVVPDEIYISAGVETRHEKLDEAKRENDRCMAGALEFLKSSGVPAKDFQTDCLSIEPVYNSDLSRTKPLVYIVRKSLQIKLTNVTNVESLLTGLLNNGVNTIHGVDFRTSQLRRYRDQARAKAIQAAREKADAMAAELGVRRGKVSNLSASDWSGWWGSYGSWGGRGGGMYQNVVQNSGGASDQVGDSLSIGQISVSATVNVSFLIE